MAHILVNFRKDTTETQSFEEVCEQPGLSITTVFWKELFLILEVVR